jgi:hypothetical protein
LGWAAVAARQGEEKLGKLELSREEEEGRRRESYYLLEELLCGYWLWRELPLLLIEKERGGRGGGCHGD